MDFSKPAPSVLVQSSGVVSGLESRRAHPVKTNNVFARQRPVVVVGFVGFVDVDKSGGAVRCFELLGATVAPSSRSSRYGWTGAGAGRFVFHGRVCSVQTR